MYCNAVGIFPVTELLVLISLTSMNKVKNSLIVFCVSDCNIFNKLFVLIQYNTLCVISSKNIHKDLKCHQCHKFRFYKKLTNFGIALFRSSHLDFFLLNIELNSLNMEIS